ncbi:MAG: DNA double-strand break repair nuclease NurA [Tissierellia bacterium]|nr:DNA double-strand break repair nuclease NurA [Tissierellia bacterium]
MYDMKEFATQLKNINFNLKNKYKDYFNISKEEFKQSMTSKVGTFYPLKKLQQGELKALGEVVGVDGSTNRVGGAYPHYIELFQGLAKSTNGREVYLTEIYTPILSTTMDEEQNRQKLLASIEVEATIEYIHQYSPSIIMMDGGFIRYKINCFDLWRELRDLCEEKDILLFGIIKDIKTNIISNALELENNIFDREILYNQLKIGELFLIDNEVNKKYLESGEGFSSAFMRLSSFPGVVGLDILESQQNQIVTLANLSYTLTPDRSRGVPLWLDIVDSEVKITDSMIHGLLEEYMDRDIYERFFVSERDKRTL